MEVIEIADGVEENKIPPVEWGVETPAAVVEFEVLGEELVKVKKEKSGGSSDDTKKKRKTKTSFGAFEAEKRGFSHYLPEMRLRFTVEKLSCGEDERAVVVNNKTHLHLTLDLKVSVSNWKRPLEKKGIIRGASILLTPSDAVDVMMKDIRETSAADMWVNPESSKTASESSKSAFTIMPRKSSQTLSGARKTQKRQAPPTSDEVPADASEAPTPSEMASVSSSETPVVKSRDQ
ncbi:hypothetical protein CRE_03382 [Caenorhabditis remanei]|uniref:Uncharacterized protein n=1 Tax=Caenorhabditis remanei TaxID=31234 RepID=E3N654_CAERE|nr:hypothetical protein CRE_03382 [Caenorhabditis remanei]